MKRPHFSTSSLMVAILLIAVGIAALSHPTEVWDFALLSLELLTLLAAIARSALARGRRRAFWVAFAIIGWGYVIFSSAPMISRSIRPRLASHMALTWLYPRLIGLIPGATQSADGSLVGDLSKLSSMDAFNAAQAELQRFIQIGHALAGLALALTFGYASWLVAPGDGEAEGATPRP